ncbi:MAG: DUF992 domain-containing protein [Aestuariivirga sp.]
MKKTIAAAMLGLALMAGASEAGDAGVKIGVLSCGIGGGIGYIIGSSKPIDCVYQPIGGGRVEHYEGRIRKFGVDVGVTGQSVVAWAVFAPGRMKRGGLRGYYAGASAEATAIVGLGANVLIGGFRDTINLQPVSVQAQTGINVAAGVTGLRLRYSGS